MDPNKQSVGSLSILNVYEGDVKITFDKDNPVETIRARRMILDLVRRGYALLIEVDGAYQRAIDFDEKVGEYIIADFDPSYIVTPNYLAQPRQERPSSEESPNVSEEPSEEKEVEASAPALKKRGRRRIAMESTAAVAVARTAGG
jgi:hypothetical protein